MALPLPKADVGARYLARTLDGEDAEAVQLGSRIRLLIEDMRAQERRARRVDPPHPNPA